MLLGPSPTLVYASTLSVYEVAGCSPPTMYSVELSVILIVRSAPPFVDWTKSL